MPLHRARSNSSTAAHLLPESLHTAKRDRPPLVGFANVRRGYPPLQRLPLPSLQRGPRWTGNWSTAPYPPSGFHHRKRDIHRCLRRTPGRAAYVHTLPMPPPTSGRSRSDWHVIFLWLFASSASANARLPTGQRHQSLPAQMYRCIPPLDPSTTRQHLAPFGPGERPRNHIQPNDRSQLTQSFHVNQRLRFSFFLLIIPSWNLGWTNRCK